MSYPRTPRISRGAMVTLVFGTAIALGVDSNATLPARDSSAEAGSLGAPLAASARPLFEDLQAPIRPQRYPGLPTANPMHQDPEQIREDLRLAVERALAEAPELADEPILVHVTSLRRARLSGIVVDESTRILAEMIAAGVHGISGVDNRLRIEAEQN